MELKAPMGGTVWKVMKHVGDSIKAGDVVIILESMKMEIPIEATADGTLATLYVNEGDFVQENDTVAVIQ